METIDFGSGGTQEAAPVADAQPGRNRWLLPALIIAGVLAIAAVAFATMNASDSGDGAESPQAAMQALFDGLADQNLLASVDAFLPSEADPATEYAVAMTDELKRLGVLSAAADPENVVGIDLEFTDVSYDVVEFAPGFARVYLTGGQATVSGDPASLPLGDLLYDNLTDEQLDELLNTGNVTETSPMTDDEFFLVAVEDDGWHLSLWYTIAEAIRLDAGGPVPDFGNPIEALGAESPEAAVRAAIEEALDLDLEGLVSMLPPEEMRALYDYLPLVLDDFDEQVGLLGAFVDIRLDSLETNSSNAADGRVRVAIETFAVSFESAFLEIDGSLAFDGECFDIAINDNGGNLSGFGELPPRINSCDVESELGSALELPDFLGDVQPATTGLIAVEEDGRWYVSPTYTVGDALLESLKVWDAESIQQYIDFLTTLDMGASPALF